MDEKFGVVESDAMLTMEGTEYMINGHKVTSNVSIDGLAQNASVKNKLLFGDREVMLQQFDYHQDEEESAASPAFVDLLEIDEFGVISVQISVHRKVKVKQNGKWVRGVVSRKMADGICVKIREGDQILFQWVQEEDISNRLKLLPFENEWEVSEYQFAARAGTKDTVNDTLNLKLFTFEDINEFQIPADSLVAESMTPDVVNIYAKPKGFELGYHLIKTVEHQFDSLCFSSYVLNQQQPFCVRQQVKIRPISECPKYDGKFEVITNSEIIISGSGGINGNGCGLTKHTKHPNQSFLKFGEFMGDSGQHGGITQQSEGAGGGIISLMAAGNVVNDGTLLCRASDNQLFSGGAVCIVTGGVFENKGIIDAEKHGMVHIECTRLVNSGQIVPAPYVSITEVASMTPLFEALTAKNGEKRMLLEYVIHREHDGDGYHPWNLLEEGTEKFYVSQNTEYGGKQPLGDWMIFRLRSEERMLPTKIGIRNRDSYSGLKSVSISGSADNEQFEEWIVIENIHNEDEDLQIFNIDPMDGLMAWHERFIFFRVEVLQNHGWKYYNKFNEFRIYGITINWKSEMCLHENEFSLL